MQVESDSNNLQSVTSRARLAFRALLTTSIIRQVALWGFTLITIRVLAPEDYGVAGLVMSLYPYLSLIASMELSEWISQRDSFDENEEKAIFSLSLFLSLSISAIAFVVSPLVCAFYETPELVPVFRCAAFVLLLQGFAFLPYSLLRREMNFKALGLIGMVAGISRAMLTLILACLGFGYWSLVAGAVLETVLTTSALVWVRGLPKRLGWNPALYREALGFGLPATAAVAFGIIFSTTDDIVVGKFFGVEALGFYTMAYYLTDLPLTKINQLIHPLLVPYFGKLRQSPEYLETAFLRVVTIVVTIHAPLLLGLCVVAPVAVPLVLGEQWIPATLAIQVMSLAVLFRGFLDKVPPLLLAVNKPKYLLSFRVVTAIALAPSFFIFASLFGMSGIYLAWLCVYPCTIVYGLFVLNKAVAINIRHFVRTLQAPLCSGLLMALTVFAFTLFFANKIESLLLLISQGTVGVLAYGAAFYLIFRSDLIELIQICRESLAPSSETNSVVE